MQPLLAVLKNMNPYSDMPTGHPATCTNRQSIMLRILLLAPGSNPGLELPGLLLGIPMAKPWPEYYGDFGYSS